MVGRRPSLKGPLVLSRRGQVGLEVPPGRARAASPALSRLQRRRPRRPHPPLGVFHSHVDLLGRMQVRVGDRGVLARSATTATTAANTTHTAHAAHAAAVPGLIVVMVVVRPLATLGSQHRRARQVGSARR